MQSLSDDSPLAGHGRDENGGASRAAADLADMIHEHVDGNRDPPLRPAWMR
jgi:hypothetical protein